MTTLKAGDRVKITAPDIYGNSNRVGQDGTVHSVGISSVRVEMKPNPINLDTSVYPPTSVALIPNWEVGDTVVVKGHPGSRTTINGIWMGHDGTVKYTLHLMHTDKLYAASELDSLPREPRTGEVWMKLKDPTENNKPRTFSAYLCSLIDPTQRGSKGVTRFVQLDTGRVYSNESLFGYSRRQDWQFAYATTDEYFKARLAGK